MSKLADMFPSQLEVVAQIETVLEDIGTVTILQKTIGVSGSEFGECLEEEFGFKYWGRGMYAKDGLLGKMIIVLDKHADNSVYVRSVDVYYETTVIAAEEHYNSKKRVRPNLMCLTKEELENWQHVFDDGLERLLDE